MSVAIPRWYASLSDVGRERSANEDARGEYALGDGSILLIVADGMGGHESGEVASRIAVDAIGQIVQNSPAEDPREKLRNGFLVANQRIIAEAERLHAEGMGTTAVSAYVRAEDVYVAHVGDSRLYHVRDGAVVWRTNDHTRVQKMVDAGIISADAAKQHPDANVVTRALGYVQLSDGRQLEPDVRESPLRLAVGDSLVLCSDGLYDGIEDHEIARLLVGKTAAEATARLVQLANERGGHDNITVTVLHFGVDRGAAAIGPAPPSGGATAVPPRAGLSPRTLVGIGIGVVGLLISAAVVFMLLIPPAAPANSDARPATRADARTVVDGGRADAPLRPPRDARVADVITIVPGYARDAGAPTPAVVGPRPDTGLSLSEIFDALLNQKSVVHKDTDRQRGNSPKPDHRKKPQQSPRRPL